MGFRFSLTPITDPTARSGNNKTPLDIAKERMKYFKDPAIKENYRKAIELLELNGA